MGLFLHIGVLILLIATYGLQVEGGGKTKDENEKTQSTATLQGGEEPSKGDKITKQTGTDESGKHDESNSDSSSDDDSGKKKTTKDDAEETVIDRLINNSPNSLKATTSDQKNEKTIDSNDVHDETKDNDHKQEKRPGIVGRITKKLSFKKSDKKVNPSTNGDDQTNIKVTEIKESLKGKDTSSSGSSSESDGTNMIQKKKVTKGKTENKAGNKLDEDSKGSEMKTGQTKEGSSSDESEDKKLNPKGKTSNKKIGAEAVKEANYDPFSESSSDEHRQTEKKTGQVKDPETRSSEKPSNSITDNGSMDSVDNKADNQQAVDQPQEGKKKGLFSRFHRPHLPGPNIGKLLSFKRGSDHA